MLDVARWLAEQGLEQYAEAFAENAIDGRFCVRSARTISRNSGSRLSVIGRSFLLRSPCSAKSEKVGKHLKSEDELSSAPVWRSGGS
jgi:SAM domain (Sterile alpha motif)